MLQLFSDAEWREHFRMCRRSFVRLCELMKSVMSPGDITMCPAIPLEMRVQAVQAGVQGQRVLKTTHVCDISGTSVYFLIVGDAAYPLLDWFMKAYKQKLF